MSEHKPGFTYMYSDILKQEMAISNKTGKVFCADGVQYTPEEVTEIKKTTGTLPLEVHLIKKYFDGTIVMAEDKK